MDAEGRLSFIGRLKDMLKVGGENVAAAEIEGFLAEHPAIAEVQVVAAPDERYQEVACAFVMLRPGAALSLDELVEHCRGQIASYKIPRYLRIVDEWPMSGTKIQKFKLRQRIADDLLAAGISEAPSYRARRRIPVRLLRRIRGASRHPRCSRARGTPARRGRPEASTAAPHQSDRLSAGELLGGVISLSPPWTSST